MGLLSGDIKGDTRSLDYSPYAPRSTKWETLNPQSPKPSDPNGLKRFKPTARPDLGRIWKIDFRV